MEEYFPLPPSKIIYGLSLSQFGNLEFMRIFGKELYFQTSFLKITNPGKNLIFLLKDAKIQVLTAFFPLSDGGSKNC
jgi:hypothetical protein